MDDNKNIDPDSIGVDEKIEEETNGSEEIGEEEEDKKPKKGSSKSRSGSGNSDEVEELKAKIVELEDQLLRAVADYRNLEKRFEDEKREFVKFANREMLLRLIPAFDTLFLAEKYVADEGIKLTIKHLQESLKGVGVERVQTSDKEFDVLLMEAVSTGDGEDGMVIEELRPGYTLNGKLVRPAQVKVGKAES
jgi:molecular chaperone GrpE